MTKLLAIGAIAFSGCAHFLEADEVIAPIRLDSITLTASEDMDAVVVCLTEPSYSYGVELKKDEPKNINALAPGCTLVSDSPASIAVRANWVTVKEP